MSLVSYMGTKAALAGPIANAFRNLPAGPLLDLFAGMSAVGRSVAPARNVWLNDIQAFSQVVSEFQFLPSQSQIGATRAVRGVLRAYSIHLRELELRFAELLRRERAAICSSNWIDLSRHEADLQRQPSNDAREAPTGAFGEYDLFTSLYAGTYLGLRQSIQVDALRKGIDAMAPMNNPGSASLRRWMIAALGSAVSRCSNSTGHFAQYLTINAGNAHRVRSQRRRDIRFEWLSRLRAAQPVGTEDWRQKNRVFSLDACRLIADLSNLGSIPAVIYADPPYTADQYSRYYHLLDTLVLYDYPEVTGKGRYRSNRFVSPWSLASRVGDCFDELVQGSARLGSALVISYPEDGLLKESKRTIPALLRKHYKFVRRLRPLPHHHSTMGASKGKQRHQVVEQLFVARNS